MIRFYTLIVILYFLTSESVYCQDFMYVSGKHKIEFQGAKIGLRKASKTLCLNCEEAKGHFSKARRIRTWNMIFSQIGFAEIIIGTLSLKDETSKGITHAAVGGGLLVFVDERNKNMKIEIHEGIIAFNRCQLINE
jgi:hypothetical protein